MNFLQLLMMLLRAQQQGGGGQQGSQPGAQANMQRGQQMLRGRPPVGGMGRMAGMAGSEGTPNELAARLWMLQNFFGTPGQGVNARDPSFMPQNPTQFMVNGQPYQGARGMEGGGPRNIANERLNWMDSMFSGEGRAPGGGGGGGFPEAF